MVHKKKLNNALGMGCLLQIIGGGVVGFGLVVGAVVGLPFGAVVIVLGLLLGILLLVLGAKTDIRNVCSNCGNRVSEVGSRICPTCGERFTN